MSFIEQEVLAEKNPLYGRATGILQMKEMDFFDAVQFFPNYSPEDKTAAYAILGDIPHYLKQFDPSLSLAENRLYKITDNFFRFYYVFVYPNTSELEYGGAPGIYTYAVAPSLDEYVSRVFEDIAVQYLRKQNNIGILPFHFIRIGRWWNKTDEIDIMALDADGSHMLVGECKYRYAVTDTDTLHSLMRKFPSSSDAEVFYCLFSKSGFTKRLLDEAGEKGVMLFELKDIAG